MTICQYRTYCKCEAKLPDDDGKPFMVTQMRTCFPGENTAKLAKSRTPAADVPELGGAGICKVLRASRENPAKQEQSGQKRLVDGSVKDTKDLKDVQFLLR